MPNESSSPDFKNSPHWIVVIGLQFQQAGPTETNLNSVRCMSTKNPTKQNERTKELLYTHIYWLGVKVIVLARILDQLVLQTVSVAPTETQRFSKIRN